MTENATKPEFDEDFATYEERQKLLHEKRLLSFKSVVERLVRKARARGDFDVAVALEECATCQPDAAIDAPLLAQVRLLREHCMFLDYKSEQHLVVRVVHPDAALLMRRCISGEIREFPVYDEVDLQFEMVGIIARSIGVVSKLFRGMGK